MKTIWVEAVPFDKEIAIAALESGADAILVEEGVTPKVKELGVIKTVAPDGDIQPGKDVEIVEVTSKEDESKASKIPPNKLVLLRMRDWKIIPIENLIASRGGGLIVEAADTAEAQTMLQVLEKGAKHHLIGVQQGGELGVLHHLKARRLKVVEVNKKEQESLHQQEKETHKVKNGGGEIRGQFLAQYRGNPGHAVRPPLP